jgi:hypothetical protein
MAKFCRGQSGQIMLLQILLLTLPLVILPGLCNSGIPQRGGADDAVL